MPPPGSTESPVKAVSPAARGRSAAESLDGIEASRTIGDVMVGNVKSRTDVGKRARGQRHAEASGDPREPVTPPAMAERDGDRDHVRPLAPRDPIEIADEFGEQIVGIELLDDQLQECA